MDEMRRAATANDGTRSKRNYFTTALKAMLIKVSEWLRLVGVNL